MLAEFRFCVKGIISVEFHLAAYALGNKPSVSASHENWLNEKLEHGWKWGAEKDAELKTHPCIVPYEQLSVEQRMKDYLFSGVVRSFFECSSV